MIRFYKFWDDILKQFTQHTISIPESIEVRKTGKECHGKRDIWEGDILFYEEETDEGDIRQYLVVTWIQEWCMFACLNIDEYHKYQEQGADALDETMFWTSALQESEMYHYAGNIYQNPELLKQ